ncbi:uncharacterized protein LOC129584014 [Paramacrobiotus metropolitanus]|uniref:uncharacterized protein LOC129584014 n=1 Tax=Paramacrobiotus metropolitanus TaxID=2943436 RepID=UPI002445E7B0|nr:uncharacterized protein LOC129584014 [Paramacrobiotus metropolitanus]
MRNGFVYPYKMDISHIVTPEYRLDFISKLHNICTFQAVCAAFSLLLRFGSAVLVVSSDSSDPEDTTLHYLRALLIGVLDVTLFSNAFFGVRLIRKLLSCRHLPNSREEIFLQSRLFASIGAVNVVLCIAHAVACVLILIPGIITLLAYYLQAHALLMDQVTWMQTVFGRQQLDDTEIAISMLYSLMVAVLCGKAAKICLRNAVILRDCHDGVLDTEEANQREFIVDGKYAKSPPPYSERDPALQQGLV